MEQQDRGRKIHVLVQIDEPLLRAGICVTLSDAHDVCIIDAAIEPSSKVAIVITDIATAGLFAERACSQDLDSPPRHARVIAVAPQPREHLIRHALERGVFGFVLTSSPVAELLAAVRAAAIGERFLCKVASRQLGQVAARDLLTSREDDVLRLLARGQCNKSIARDLEIAVGTVKVHVKSIFAKLDATSRTQAVSIATERGIVDMHRCSLPNIPRQIQNTSWCSNRASQLSFA